MTTDNLLPAEPFLVTCRSKRSPKRVRFYEHVDVFLLPDNDDYDRSSINVSHVYYSDYVQFRGKPASHLLSLDKLDSFNEKNKRYRDFIQKEEQSEQHFSQSSTNDGGARQWNLSLSVSQTMGGRKLVTIVSKCSNSLVDIVEQN